MTSSNDISKLNQKLKLIESGQQVNELVPAAIGGAVAAGRLAPHIAKFGKGFIAGAKNLKNPHIYGKASTGANKGQVVNKAGNLGSRTGAAVTSRPAALAAGGALAYGASRNSQQPQDTGGAAQPPAKSQNTGGAAQPQAKSQGTGGVAQPQAGNAAPPGLTAAETAEIHKLALELSKFKDSNEQVSRAYLDYLNKFPTQ